MDGELGLSEQYLSLTVLINKKCIPVYKIAFIIGFKWITASDVQWN